MLEKFKIRGDIKRLKRVIDDLEKKRLRSQSALVTAILEHKDPSEADVEFFNNYTKQIDQARAQLAEKERDLAAI